MEIDYDKKNVKYVIFCKSHDPTPKEITPKEKDNSDTSSLQQKAQSIDKNIINSIE
jgi:hypothetical protein